MSEKVFVLKMAGFLTELCALLTEPHERQERDLAFSDRYGSVSDLLGANYICFSASFLFTSLSLQRISFGDLSGERSFCVSVAEDF